MTILINNIGDITPFSPPHVEIGCPGHGCMCIFNSCSCVAAGGGCGDLWHQEPCNAM